MRGSAARRHVAASGARRSCRRRIDAPDVVRAEYSSKQGLLGRRAAYEHAEGPDLPVDVAMCNVLLLAPVSSCQGRSSLPNGRL
jgi:hypothetical protein